MHKIKGIKSGKKPKAKKLRKGAGKVARAARVGSAQTEKVGAPSRVQESQRVSTRKCHRGQDEEAL